MVGDIGEAFAAEMFGLSKLPESTRGVDAVAPDGREVQIKNTGRGRSVALYHHVAEHVIALQTHADGRVEVVYNGPGEPVWQAVASRKPEKNGQKTISLRKLRQLMSNVYPAQRLPEVHR